MGAPPSLVEPGRAGRGPSSRPAITAAASCLQALVRAVRLLAGEPGRRLRLQAALRRLGATVAASAGERGGPATLGRLLAVRLRAERWLAGTAPPWPDGDRPALDRALGSARCALLRYAGPRQLARWRLRVAEARLGAAAVELVDPADLPGPVLALRQHAVVVSEALDLARAGAVDSLDQALAAGGVLATILGERILAAAEVAARAAVVTSLAVARVAVVASVALGRGLRALALASVQAVRVVLAVTLAAAQALARPLGPLVGVLAAPPDPGLPAWRRFLRPVAAALGLTMLAATLAGLPAAAVLHGSVRAASAGLPDLGDMQPLAQPERTQVYDRNGRLIEVLHDEQDRIVVPLSAMPEVLRNAVLAAEDERFYQHHGIDDRGILRALLANLIEGQTVQGGSTITQQLVRNAYPDLRDRSLVRKVKEASLAAQLEERMSKDEILQAYLNRVYFGAGYYGVEAASRGYFGRHVSDLTLAQAATLAGIIREPERSNPRSAPDRALQRRNTVLQQMGALGMAAPADIARATRSRLVVQPPRRVGGRYPWFIDALKRQLLDDPRLGRTVAERNRKLYEGGLRIDTTLDTTAQQQAEQAAAKWRPASGPDVALVAIDPRDGAVRAMVGGRDFRRRQFNLAVQGERQAGSAFKPFVLAAALDDGISPDSLWESSGFSGQVCGSPWTVSNYEGKGSGRMSLREATWHSVNGVYARVMERLCPARVVGMAERLGLDVPERQSHAPSIALGAANVSPLGMASAYATLADQGVYQRPVLFTKVSRHGRTLFENRPEGERRISAALAYQVTDVLKGVVQHGTATAAAIGRPVAGKTGTTQDYRDAWFVGYTPQLATAVWMGYPGREVPMLDVGGIRVTGGSYPARIWHDFMLAAMAGQPALDWRRPPGTLGFTLLPPANQQPGAQGTLPRKRRHGHGPG